MSDGPSNTHRCTVCMAPRLDLLDTIGGVPYWRCHQCQCTLMDPSAWLAEDAERDVYDLHDNNPEDPGYRRFLGKLATPLMERLPRGATGLDFGCGPGPALAAILGDNGMRMSLYDPFFHPDEDALSRHYDFITCTEVVEHLHQPFRIFALLDRLLSPGGLLGVMTCFQTDDSRFANWHYRRDPTHVVFYREATMDWIANRFGWSLEVPAKDVAIFRKPG